MTDNKDAEIAALRERLERLERAPEPPVTHPAKSGGIGKGCAIVAIVGVGLLIALCSQMGSSPTSGIPTVTASAWQPPAGYNRYDAGGSQVGVEWSDAKRSECRSGRACWAVNVITERDCPRTLYASITLLDRSGNNVGWTNDTAQGVQAGEKTRLVFTTYEETANTARIAEIHCR